MAHKVAQNKRKHKHKSDNRIINKLKNNYAIYTVQVPLTTRNIFIVNLALSDLLLCTFTMPLTLVDIITKYFPLGPDLVSGINL